MNYNSISEIIKCITSNFAVVLQYIYKYNIYRQMSDFTILVNFTCRGCNWCLSMMMWRGLTQSCFCWNVTSAVILGKRPSHALITDFVCVHFPMAAGAEKT